MEKAWVPGDTKEYQMMCDRLTIKATKFQVSPTVFELKQKLPGGGANRYPHIN